MSLDPLSYKLGKKTIDRLIKSMYVFSADKPLSAISPYLTSKNCVELKQAILLYFTHHTIKWIYEPAGALPSAKAMMIISALCGEGLPLDTQFLEELSTEELKEHEEKEE
ncbi:MAG: hypothetical protein QXM76_01480 [Zestosphaera sp.]